VADYHTTETFFRPPEVARLSSAVPAEVHNTARNLLARSRDGCVFVPIRSMQFLGVIDRDEIVFVDSQAYAHQDGVGGRLILIAWQPRPEPGRDSLAAPVPCDIVCYDEGLEQTQQRLVSEFPRALRDLDQRFRDAVLPARGARILPFAPRS
jgi:hypothetical protein